MSSLPMHYPAKGQRRRDVDPDFLNGKLSTVSLRPTLLARKRGNRGPYDRPVFYLDHADLVARWVFKPGRIVRHSPFGFGEPQEMGCSGPARDIGDRERYLGFLWKQTNDRAFDRHRPFSVRSS